jgi:hypothetical protein
MSLIFATQLTAIATTALALLALVTAVYAVLDHTSPHPFRWAATKREARSSAGRASRSSSCPRSVLREYNHRQAD